VEVLAFLLLLTGIIMNFQVLRRLGKLNLAPAQVIRTQPWLVSVGLIGCGVVLLVVAHF
jgi:hypothetical protein